MQKFLKMLRQIGAAIAGYLKRNGLDIICGLLILLFAYAGGTKLIGRHDFRVNLDFSPWQLLAKNSTLISWVIPISELIAVVLLLVPFLRTLGLWISTILMFSFTAYLAILLSSGVKLPCSCGGVISHMSWKWHLVMNVFFLVISIWGLQIVRKRKNPAPPETDLLDRPLSHQLS